MQHAIYKVEITFLANKDDFENGYTGEYGTEWQESKEFTTLKEVKQFVKDNTYSGYKYIEYDEFNKNYRTSYLTDDNNQGEMYKTDVEKWKRGEINGWSVDCEITVKKYTPKIIGNIKFN